MLNGKKENQMNLAYVLPYKGANLFIAVKTPLKHNYFVLSEWEWWWLALCLGVMTFIMSALFLILSPLFSAYIQLKKALFQYGFQGAFPAISSYNPFLRFYSDIRETIQNRQAANTTNPPSDKKPLTFKNILEKEYQRLKTKYPKLSIQQKLKDNVAVWQFASFMKKILSALLLNALEAMGGSPQQNITLKSWKKEGHFIFTIEDKGPGMTEEEMKKAFSLYYSTKSQMGVGLNIVKALVTANKGNIELTPSEGGGTKVRVSLPVSCFLKTQNSRSFSFIPKNESENHKDKTSANIFSTKHPNRTHKSGSVH